VFDYDQDVSRPKDVAMEPTPSSTELASDALLEIGLTPDLSVSSVRYAPAQSSLPPAGVLSITQVALDAGARDEADAIEALARRLGAEPQK